MDFGDTHLRLMSEGMEAYRSGRYGEALRKCERALRIAEKNKFVVHPYFYSNMGIVYQAVGAYERALEWLHKALTCMTSFFPPEHPEFAGVYMNIGLVYKSMDKRAEALENYQQSLKLFKKSSQRDCLGISQACANIGNILMSLKEYSEALKMYDDSIKFTKDSSIIDIPFTHIAKVLLAKSSALISQKKYEDAAVELDHALNINDGNPVLEAVIYHNKSLISRSLDEYEKELASLERCFEIRQESLPENYRELAESCADIVIWHHKHGWNTKASKYLSLLINMIPLLYTNLMQIYSEELRKRQLQQFLFLPSLIHAMVNRYHGISLERSYHVLLYTKDIGIESEFAISEGISSERYPEHTETFEKLRNMRLQYQNLNAASGKASLLEEIINLERSLAPYVWEIDFKLRMESMAPEKILNALPANCALLEYSIFYDENPEDILGKGKDYYFVYLLRDGKIKEFTLGEKRNIDSKIAAARERITSIAHTSSQELSELYRQLIDPLAENLDGIEHIYIAPDEELFNLPFELLLDENDTALSAGFSISYLSSGRDFARLKKQEESFHGYNSAAVLADPAYDLPDDVAYSHADDNDIQRQPRGGGELRRFPQLPGTRAEGQSLVRIFKGAKEERYEREQRKLRYTR